MQILTIFGQIKNYLIDSFWGSNGDIKYGEKIALACADFIRNRCTSEDLRTASKKDITYLASNVESLLDSATINMTVD
jgi:hypothetical protein